MSLSQNASQHSNRRTNILAEPSASSDSNDAAEILAFPADYNCANLLFDYLQAEEVQYVFGVPGGALAEFMRVANASRQITFVVSKHEGGGAFMADGYARVSGKLGVCVSTTGPGATNMMTGVAVAHFDGVPLLSISGCTARHEVGKAALQETSSRGVDTAAIFRSISHFSEILPAAEAMPALLSSALRHCWAGGRGAAYIGLPTDLSTAAIDPRLAPKRPEQYRMRGASLCDEAAVGRAARALAAAKRPLIFAGSGCRGLGEPVLLSRLAERLGAGVATTLKAKGVMPEDHPLSLRNFGVAGSLWANEWVVDAHNDLILVLGSSLSDWATGNWNEGLFAGRKVIQVDIDPRNICSWAPVDEVVIGDMNAVLASLHRQLDEYAIAPLAVSHRRAQLQAFKAQRSPVAEPEATGSDQVPLKPQRVIRELEDALPDDAVLFVDSGNTTAWTLHYLTLRAQQQFHCGTRLLSMGYAFAASVGGKLAAPDKPVIAIGGDGALLMNGTELHTAAQMQLGLVWICFFDQQLGTVFHGNRTLIGTGAYADMSPFDPVAFAASMGAVGVRITDPGELAPALDEALARQRPTLICVVIDPNEAPPFGARFAARSQQMGTIGDFADRHEGAR